MFIKKLKVKSFIGLFLLSSITSIGFQQSARAEENITLADMVSSEAFLHQTADMMNQRLPMMLDGNTRWDASFAGPGKSLNYNYTLVDYSAADIDGSVLARNARAMLAETVCNDPSMMIFPQEGVLLNFNYYDNTRNLIARVKVKPSDCGY